MSEEDLVLCERAAKLAGVKVGRRHIVGDHHGLYVLDDDHGICGDGMWFRPLDDDAQAFRLAARLRISIIHEEEFLGGKSIPIVEAISPRREDGSRMCPMHSLDDDPPAAIRRVIVQCAVEM